VSVHTGERISSVSAGDLHLKRLPNTIAIIVSLTGRHTVTNARDIPGRDLIKSLEGTIVSSYDHELAQFRSMKRFGWGAFTLALLAAAVTIFGAETYNGVLAFFAGAAALGWLVSRAEWESTRRQIARLESELGAHGIYIGGRGREVYLTTNAYDNAWGDAVGEWLRSPLPNESDDQSAKRQQC